MANINWNVLPAFETSGSIKVPWILVYDSQLQATHLQIKAEGAWTPIGGQLAECGPDGLMGPPLQTDRLVAPDCPVGALIGKFGGSSSTLTPAPAAPVQPPTAPVELTGDKAFAIGSYCVIKIPTTYLGPLYVSFNGLIRPVEVARLKITISTASP